MNFSRKSLHFVVVYAALAHIFFVLIFFAIALLGKEKLEALNEPILFLTIACVALLLAQIVFKISRRLKLPKFLVEPQRSGAFIARYWGCLIMTIVVIVYIDLKIFQSLAIYLLF